MNKRPPDHYCTKYPLTKELFLAKMQDFGGTLFCSFFAPYPGRVATDEEEQINDLMWEILEISKKARTDVIAIFENAGIKDRLISAHLEVTYD